MVMNESLREVFAKNIKRFRTERNLTQEELSLSCGLHRSHVNTIERSEVNVTLDTIEKLAKVLDIPEKDLLERHPSAIDD